MYDYYDMELQVARAEFILSGKKNKTFSLECDTKLSSDKNKLCNERRHDNIVAIQKIAKNKTKKRK